MDATYPPEHSDYDALGCDGRWLVLTAGCTRVHQAAPQFPAALCASLPAVGPYAKNQG
jgi:hypothetical protein